MKAVTVAVTYAVAIAVGGALWLWMAGLTRVWCPDPYFYVDPQPPGFGCVVVHRMPDWVAALSGLTGCVAVLATGRGGVAFLGRRHRST